MFSQLWINAFKLGTNGNLFFASMDPNSSGIDIAELSFENGYFTEDLRRNAFEY